MTVIDSLDISMWTFKSGANVSLIFGSDSPRRGNQTFLDISSMDFSDLTGLNSNAFNGIKDTCEIIVKSQYEVDWFTANVPRITNVHVKA